MAIRVSVTVDDREPAGVIAAVRDHPDIATVAVERLPAGDLVVESMAVERKTIRDYVSAVIEVNTDERIVVVKDESNAIRISRIGVLERRFDRRPCVRIRRRRKLITP